MTLREDTEASALPLPATCVVVNDGRGDLSRLMLTAIGGNGLELVETDDGAEALRMLETRDAAALVAAVTLDSADGTRPLIATAVSPDDDGLPVIVVATAGNPEPSDIHWVLLEQPLSAGDLRAAVIDETRRGRAGS